MYAFSLYLLLSWENSQSVIGLLINCHWQSERTGEVEHRHRQTESGDVPLDIVPLLPPTTTRSIEEEKQRCPIRSKWSIVWSDSGSSRCQAENNCWLTDRPTDSEESSSWPREFKCELKDKAPTQKLKVTHWCVCGERQNTAVDDLQEIDRRKRGTTKISHCQSMRRRRTVSGVCVCYAKHVTQLPFFNTTIDT